MNDFDATPVGHFLPLGGEVPLEVSDAGLMISRGTGRHIAREIPHFVLLFVREGTLHMEEEGRPFELKAGQTLLLWPGRFHRGTQDYAPDLQFYWIHFTLSEKAFEQASVSVPQHSTLMRPDFVNELFRRYLDDLDTGQIDHLGASLYVWMILKEIALVSPASDQRAASILAGRAYTHIRSHFHEKLTASGIAEALGYNPQYLSRAFKQVYNQSITFTIHQVRITYAKKLMLHSNYNIAEVAKLCGFEDAAYFQRIFKQLENTTPLRYQRLRARLRVNG
ncbi:AraC family transcriptional regulator [bacterium]|nr:MAG: AraC family transcriptional regulator [bacterium]